MKLYTAAITMALFTGCGYFDPKVDEETKPESESNSTYTEIKGSVQYAFPVDVSGKKYDDMETYYSEEAKNLLAKVQAAGYPDIDKAEFDAKIGFDDLVEGMKVYVATKAGQQIVTVDDSGNFVAKMEGKVDKFKYRANKRVAIKLYKNDTLQQKVCYNFFSSEKETTENPIVLNKFDSSFTLYSCDAKEDTAPGIVIPKSTTTTSEPVEPHKLNVKVAEFCPAYSCYHAVVRGFTEVTVFVLNEGKLTARSYDFDMKVKAERELNKDCAYIGSFDVTGLDKPSFNLKTAPEAYAATITATCNTQAEEVSTLKLSTLEDLDAGDLQAPRVISVREITRR
jgi:hypothetical protein